MLDKIFICLTRADFLNKRMWRGWYGYLSRNYQQADWTFMNYGFEGPNGVPELDEADERERYCIQLYHHVAASIPLQGKSVLEVGSGRGGGASFIARYLKPSQMIGVDLSEDAVVFCRNTHRVPHLSFESGDAESLPFDNNAFDVVVNIESSHCYPHPAAFFSEVFRILKPLGYFLYADFRCRSRVEEWETSIRASGLTIVSETDITKNIVRALDLDNDRKLALMKRCAPSWLHNSLNDFAAVQGSKMYEQFRSGSLVYLSFVARKQS